MRLRVIVKVGTIISVLLFCMTLAYYAFMRLDMTERNRSVNLYSMVPADCVAVLESDDIDRLMDDALAPNYSDELERFRFPGLFDFILRGLKEYTSDNVHGLGHQMGHLLVSFHRPSISDNQVIYFRMDTADDKILSDMLQEYMPVNFLPKEETYRGKKVVIYPLGKDEFLTTYAENGFFVLSYQKRLIEQVIDAGLDKNSLQHDAVFSQIVERKKSRKYLTLYARNAAMPFLEQDVTCWNEYEFHVNTDVLYLTGETFASDDCSCVEMAKEHIAAVPLIKEEQWIVSSDRDSTMLYINEASEANENGNRTLFNECVSNLSYEASFTFVADMDWVADNPQHFVNYLPPFMLSHASLLRSFVLSVQLMANEERPSHIWVFTYKN